MTEKEILEKIELNVMQGRRDGEDEGLDEDMAGTPGVAELVREALEDGISARKILLDSITSGMEEVGRKYEDGTYFLPDMLTAAEAVEAGMKILEPYLKQAGVEPKGKVIVATVKGDLHDIGKNIVGLMLKGAGYEVIDLGSDVEPERIASAVGEGGTDILGLSALLTTTMPSMEKTIGSLVGSGIRSEVKVMVGGAPVTAEFSKKIGADGYGRDAFEAVRLADRFVSA
jgi:5-methyltetrahydrofolate--homocysteine methyltransferase